MLPTSASSAWVVVQGVVGLRMFGVSTELELPEEVVAHFCSADFAARTAHLASETGQRVIYEQHASHIGPC